VDISPGIATEVRFGKTRIYIYSSNSNLMAHLKQVDESGATGSVVNADECKRDQRLSIMLHRTLDTVLKRSKHPTVHLGCVQGLHAIAEELVVDDTPSLYRILVNFFVDLFSTPKIYRGHICLRSDLYDLVIYESDKVPGTELEFVIKA